jgi:hypothetical protein
MNIKNIYFNFVLYIYIFFFLNHGHTVAVAVDKFSYDTL